jgi:pimeloyl-ACP methyl ester carboxylesterase
VRTDVDFHVNGVRCHAWLYWPDRESASRSVDKAGINPSATGVPVVVMAHGLGGTKAMRLDAFAECFVGAGYACLVFDYRHFGASDGQPRQLLSVREQLIDWEAAIAFARRLPGVDPDKVVTWGTSFGGGHSLMMAERDDRLAAAIAQCPFTDGLASTLAIPPLTRFRLTVAAARDGLRQLRKAQPLYVPTTGEPGTTAFLTAPDSLPGTRAIRSSDFDNRLTARSAIEVLFYAPGRHTRAITCPVFVALCENDTVAPSRTAARQLAKNPRIRMKSYPIAHFDIYLGEAFERAVQDYLAFLRRHVPVAGA